jgi:tRNA (guanine37-N1)-methyltransferase
MLSVKDGGVIHYYGFGPEEDLYSEHEAKIKAVARELGFTVEFLEERKVRPYAPRQFNIAIDFRVLK